MRQTQMSVNVSLGFPQKLICPFSHPNVIPSGARNLLASTSTSGLAQSLHHKDIAQVGNCN